MDDYTPYGYLDNPWHTATKPSGVVRSQPAVGFAWHFPALRGPYVRHWVYRAALRFALLDDSRPLLTSEQFLARDVKLVSHLHSQHIISFDWQYTGLDWSVAFFLNGEHSLCARLRATNTTQGHARANWAFVAEYERNIGATNAWDCGVLSRYESTRNYVSLLTYPEGDAFCLRADREPSNFAIARSAEDVFDRSDRPAIVMTALAAGSLFFAATLPPGEATEMITVLSRSQNGDRAVRTASAGLSTGSRRFHEVLASSQLACQERPALIGDWPDYWRRGFVYDFETLRSIIRQPCGTFRHRWDTMQMQSPRLVLAEAALDALALSYADISTAQEVLLGGLVDSGAPNAPCKREDGSYNMIAEDGEVCGTAPEWGFPIYCADLLYRRSGDRQWLARIYPRLSRYLAWWLRHRSDGAGWLHYHCSWESGQDDSPRFGPQEGGGALITHVRPVDLHAAVAQGAAILGRIAAELGQHSASARWVALAERYAAMTRTLFHDSWFRDFDTRLGRPSPVRDVMHLAPLLAGVADDEQREALRKVFSNLPPHGIWPPLDWPPVVFTAIEAACNTGWHDLAGQLAAEVADRVYRAYDNRQPAANDPLPGIAHERWASAGSWGCEGYGWGALCALLVIRHVVGWHETPDGAIELRPVLPRSWLAKNLRLSIGPLRHRGQSIAIELLATTNDLIVRLKVAAEAGVAVRDSAGAIAAAKCEGDEVVWRAQYGEASRIELGALIG